MKKRKVDNQKKHINEIDIIRFFCIVSVIGAHFSGKVFSTFTGIPLFLFYCCRAYGTVGVVGFFILSGFLYNSKGKKFSDVLVNKIKYVLLPTYIAAVICFTITHINNFSIKELIIYCYGGGSLYYYITVLMFCYVVFYFIDSNKWLLYGAIIINVISILLFASDIIMYEQLPFPYITSYLIPTNWIGFFSLGIILREKKMWKKVVLWTEKHALILVVSFCIVTVLYAYSSADSEISYFVWQSIPYELFGTVTIFGISSKLKSWNWLRKVGNSSFFIYLYHINIIGFISNRFCFTWFVVLLYPVMVVLGLWICCHIIKWIVNRMGFSKYLFLLGIKE